MKIFDHKLICNCIFSFFIAFWMQCACVNCEFLLPRLQCSTVDVPNVSLCLSGSGCESVRLPSRCCLSLKSCSCVSSNASPLRISSPSELLVQPDASVYPYKAAITKKWFSNVNVIWSRRFILIFETLLIVTQASGHEWVSKTAGRPLIPFGCLKGMIYTNIFTSFHPVFSCLWLQMRTLKLIR